MGASAIGPVASCTVTRWLLIETTRTRGPAGVLSGAASAAFSSLAGRPPGPRVAPGPAPQGAGLPPTTRAGRGPAATAFEALLQMLGTIQPTPGFCARANDFP